MYHIDHVKFPNIRWLITQIGRKTVKVITNLRKTNKWKLTWPWTLCEEDNLVNSQFDYWSVKQKFKTNLPLMGWTCCFGWKNELRLLWIGMRRVRWYKSLDIEQFVGATARGRMINKWGLFVWNQFCRRRGVARKNLISFHAPLDCEWR